jgi:thioredoxin 1
MIEFNASQFEEQVVREGRPALVEFWAPWCVYCRLLKPKVERLGRAFGAALLVGRVDVVAEEALARSQGITCVPGLALFIRSQSVQIWYGDVPEREISNLIASWITGTAGEVR